MLTTGPDRPTGAKVGSAAPDRRTAAWTSGGIAVTAHVFALAALAHIGFTGGDLEGDAHSPDGSAPVLIATLRTDPLAPGSDMAARRFANPRTPSPDPNRAVIESPPLESIALPVPAEPADPAPPPEFFNWRERPLAMDWPTSNSSEGSPDPAGPAKARRSARTETGSEKPGTPSLTHATPLSSPRPRYPRDARRRELEGTVYLLLSIGNNGKVLDANVRRSSGHASLDSAALRCVARWKFRPATRAGVPTASEVVVPVGFQLR